MEKAAAGGTDGPGHVTGVGASFMMDASVQRTCDCLASSALRTPSTATSEFPATRLTAERASAARFSSSALSCVKDDAASCSLTASTARSAWVAALRTARACSRVQPPAPATRSPVKSCSTTANRSHCGAKSRSAASRRGSGGSVCGGCGAVEVRAAKARTSAPRRARPTGAGTVRGAAGTGTGGCCCEGAAAAAGQAIRGTVPGGSPSGCWGAARGAAAPRIAICCAAACCTDAC
mmetsp:Transcript_31471/g.100318  ORF Transcript_31471/g.100318 Transcript_31471/m.100318 type:complete len:236 (+) Transcript_31471:186-893(+)